MKFTCESCGKRFASVDEPLPGRVYKIRCRRCGHLISVQAPVPWEEPAEQLVLDVPAASHSGARASTPAPSRHEALVAGLQGLGSPADGTEEVSIDLALSDEYPLMRRRRSRRKAAAVAVLAGTAALALALLVLALGDAGRVSATAAGGRPDRTAPGPEPAEERAEPDRPAPAGATASASAPDGAEPTEGVVAGGAGVSTVAPARSAEPRRPRAEPGRPAPSRARVAFERDERPGPPVPVAPARGSVDPGLAAALLAKDDVAVRAVPADVTELRALLDGRRPALAACFEGEAGGAGAAAWKGRRPHLVVRIDPSGRAAGHLDDGALEPTQIASCLRRTVARTAFPTFSGEPVEIKVPVSLP